MIKTMHSTESLTEIPTVSVSVRCLLRDCRFHIFQINAVLLKFNVLTHHQIQINSLVNGYLPMKVCLDFYFLK